MTVPECKTCREYAKAGNVCGIDQAIYMDPDDGICHGFDQPDPSPAVQITKHQYDSYLNSNFELIIERQKIVDVRVPWLPEVPLLTPIPSDKALSFALIDEATMGFLTNSTHESHPRFLACGSMGSMWNDARILKVWGEPRRERVSLTMNRTLATLVPWIVFLETRIESSDREWLFYPEDLHPGDVERTIKYWSEIGYQAGKGSNNQPYLAYNYEGRQFLLFFDPMIPALDFEEIQFEEPIDSIPLEHMSLSTRCLGCGYDSESKVAPWICPACNMHYPPLRFEEER